MANANIWTAALALSLLVGCSQDGDGQRAGRDSETKSPTAATDGRTPVVKRVKVPLFEDYVPRFPHSLRADKIVQLPDGRLSRQVTLEYLGDDQQKIDEAIAGELKVLGYKRGPERWDGDVLRVSYSKKGAPKVALTLYPAGSSKTRVADAGGFARFSWDASSSKR